MNLLYSRADRVFQIVLSGNNCPNFFANIQTSQINSIPYSPTAIVQNDEWFKVDISSIPNVVNPLDLLHRQVATGLRTIDKNQYTKIKYFIFKRDSEDWYYVQRVMSGAKVYNKKILSFSSQPNIIEEPIVIIGDHPDAVYDIANKIVFFKSLSAISHFFSGIDALYRVATDAEVNQFLSLGGLLAVDPSFTKDKVGIPNRKNIAKTLDFYNNLASNTKAALHSYVQGLGLPCDANNKYIINDDKSLKAFIFALQERYYTTDATTEKRLAQAYVRV